MCSVGWQGTLRNAQGGNKETMNTANTGNTVNGLWQPVCHALWNFDSTGLCVLLAGKAHSAMHREGANPTMNTMNTGNTIDGLWYTVSHVLRKFHGTWLTRFLVLTPVFLVFPVFPVGLARSIGRAHGAKHRVGANPTMNTMNTGNTIDGQWHTVSHVLRKFHGTWLTRFPVLSPVFLVLPVFPVGLAPSIGSAQSALPANSPLHPVPRKIHSP